MKLSLPSDPALLPQTHTNSVCSVSVSVWQRLSAGQVVFVQKHWLCQRGNTEPWVFAFSSVASSCSLEFCFSESLFAGVCYWTRPGLSQQAPPIPEGIAPPSTAILRLWEQTLSGCLSVSMFLVRPLSFLCGSSISTALVPVRCWHSTAKHEAEAWELKISPVITEREFEFLLNPFLVPNIELQLIHFTTEMMNSWGNGEFIVSNLSYLLSNFSLRAIKLVSMDFAPLTPHWQECLVWLLLRGRVRLAESTTQSVQREKSPSVFPSFISLLSVSALSLWLSSLSQLCNWYLLNICWVSGEFASVRLF